MPQATAAIATTILTSVVRSLVKQPEDVRVEALPSERSVELTLHVSPVDLDTVMGTNRRTARSLATIVAALGKRSGVQISLEIAAPARL